MNEHAQERAYLLAVLDLWAQAESQGVDPETVKSFGFDPRLCSNPKEKREALRWKRTERFNYVRHHDGTRTKLDPPLRAVYRD